MSMSVMMFYIKMVARINSCIQLLGLISTFASSFTWQLILYKILNPFSWILISYVSFFQKLLLPTNVSAYKVSSQLGLYLK